MDVESKLEEAKSFIEGVDRNNDPFDLIVAREDDDADDGDGETTYRFGRAKTVGNLPERLGNFVESRVGNKIKGLEEGTKEGTEYRASNISDQTDYIQHVEPDDVPRFHQYEELLDDPEFDSADYINEHGDPPLFQVILVRDGDGSRLLVFQDITRREVLGKNDKIRFYSADDHYKEINNTILEVPNRIDVIYYDDTLFIFDQRRFERIFDYMEEFHAEAEATVETITESKVPIHSDERFLDAVTSYPNATRILYAVRERALWEHENVDMDTFEYVIDEFDLSIDVEEREGERGIVMEDKRKVWEVIHLYNDDHLNSPITEVGYQVDGKDARTEEADSD